MKAMDLLVGFGSVKDSYVISAEEFRPVSYTHLTLPTKLEV